MVIWVSVIVCIIGLVSYALSSNPKVQAIALHCFWVGLLVFLLRWGGALVLKP
jgi:hypothetical protein